MNQDKVKISFKVQYMMALEWSDYPGMGGFGSGEAALETARTLRRNLMNESIKLRVVETWEQVIGEV